ncbi:hypothetical protein G6F57_015019 [Rhizopus arrhizus]|nr:hypothetical protein G6F57_015019 [Rhizopus arrhizus]
MVARLRVALVGEVGQVQRHGQVLRWAQRAEVIGHRGIDQPVARHRHIVGVGHVALADMVGRQAHVPRARGPCQGAGEHPLRGVDGLLAARRHHAVVHVVVVVGAVIPRQRVGPGQVLHRLQLQVRLGAAAGHRTDVGEQRRAAEDAHALGDRQQAVVELDVVHRDRGFIPLAVATPAQFERTRLFLLQVLRAGVERGLRHVERAAHAQRIGRDVLGERTEDLVAFVELEVEAGLRQEALPCGQAAVVGIAAQRRAHAGAGVRRLRADVDGQAVIEQAEAVLHVELAGDGGVALVPHALVRIAQEEVVGDRAVDVVEVALHAVAVVLVPEAGFEFVAADIPGECRGHASAVDRVLGGADRDRDLAAGARIGRIGRAEPVALATVAVVVDVDLQPHRFVQAEITGDAGQVIVAQAMAGVVRIPRAVDAAAESATCGGDRAIPVRRVVVPVPAEAIDHLQRQGLVVRFDAPRDVEQRGDLAVRTEVVGRLAVELFQLLRALALPLVAF